MREENESHYSFLIAFARQLAAAIEVGDRIESVAIAVSSVATSLATLLADGSIDTIEDTDDADDVDDDDDPSVGHDDELAGGALTASERLELDRLRAAALAAPAVSTRLVGSGGQAPTATRARRAPVLKKGAKRRGKK